MIKIRAEPPLGNGLFQIRVGGEEEPQIEGDVPLGAHRAHALVLQNPQQSRLNLIGHLGDLIKKQRAAVRVQEQPVPAAILIVQNTEQLVRDAIRRDGRAVDRHERLF